MTVARTLSFVMSSPCACGDDTKSTDEGDAAATETVTTETVTIETVTTETVDEPDVVACDYVAEARVFDCAGVLTAAAWWSDRSAACPAYYSVGEAHYDDAVALESALGCTSCEYRPDGADAIVACSSGENVASDKFSTTQEPCNAHVWQTPDGFVRDLCEWSENLP